MIKLLRGNFKRLFKSKLFWITTAGMFLFGLVMPVYYYFVYKTTYGHGTAYDSVDISFYIYCAVIAFVSSFFIPLFVGTEYSDGGMRNKLIVGHKRAGVYLSSLITSVCLALSWAVAYIVPRLAAGIPLLGNFTAGIENAVKLMLVSFGIIVATCSLFTMITMLISNKSSAIVACVVCFALLFALGFLIQNVLSVPEFLDVYKIDENNRGYYVQEPHPEYISGTSRDICELLRDSLIGSQSVDLTSGYTEELESRLKNIVTADIITVLLTTVIGISAFKRKDIK